MEKLDVGLLGLRAQPTYQKIGVYMVKKCYVKQEKGAV